MEARVRFGGIVASDGMFSLSHAGIASKRKIVYEFIFRKMTCALHSLRTKII